MRSRASLPIYRRTKAVLTVDLATCTESGRDGFPQDFDIDAALREIRGEWQREVEESIQ
jgi:hypothetical protein